MWLFAKLSVVPVFSQFLATLLFSDYFPPISRVVNSVYLPDKEPPPSGDGGFEGSARLSSEITVWAETLSGGKAACIKMMSIMQNILMLLWREKL